VMGPLGRLDLLSFVPGPPTRDLCLALSDLGYAAQELSPVDWTAGAPRAAPLILFLGRDEYPRERLCSFLSALNGTPRMGVFERESFSDHSAIMSCCTDFLAWPANRDELTMRLRRAGITAAAGWDEEKALRESFVRLDLHGSSPAFVRVLRTIDKLGRADAPVLIQGETGTGKELIARAIHRLGKRKDGPFIPVNCGALPDNLVENELFGHERGAFTDAKTSQAGLVAQAHGGTLFLDEVEGLSPKAQVALLRFLQDHEYKPLGSAQVRKADVRIVTATHVELEELVREGAFRQDLMFRLDILKVKLPPLASRDGDVELLASHFIHRFSRRYGQPLKGVHPAALHWMNGYHWPGNVRELENVVHRAFVLSEGPSLELRHFVQTEGGGAADRGGEAGAFAGSFADAKARLVERFERQYLTWVMRETGGNVTAAARRAGKERRSLGKLLKKHGIRKGCSSTNAT